MASKYQWIDTGALMGLPTTGKAWEAVNSWASKQIGAPNLADQDSPGNVIAFAKALVSVRTNNTVMRGDVVQALRSIAGGNSENGARALALGRELCAYVLAADIIDLDGIDAGLNDAFKAKIRALLTSPTKDGPKNLVECHEKRPNNWGTHAGASRIAVALYLDDTAEVQRAADVFHGWLGNRSAYAGFDYGDLDWQADPAKPVGINPLGATRNGHNIDGALPEEMRRGDTLKFPPKLTGYAWEALQGAIVQAQLLARDNYDTWQWQDRALLRAAKFLARIDWQADGDDSWQPWLINFVYGATLPAIEGSTPGKNLGFTDWTHASLGSTGEPPPPPPPPPPEPDQCADRLAELEARLAQITTLAQQIAGLAG